MSGFISQNMATTILSTPRCKQDPSNTKSKCCCASALQTGKVAPAEPIILTLKKQNTQPRGSDIQGDSGGICTTLGNDSMSDSKQKSSYEHGSDFEQLRSYERLKLGIEGNDY